MKKIHNSDILFAVILRINDSKIDSVTITVYVSNIYRKPTKIDTIVPIDFNAIFIHKKFLFLTLYYIDSNVSKTLSKTNHTNEPNIVIVIITQYWR